MNMQKMVAPIIFALIFTAFVILYFAMIMQIPMSVWIKVLIALGFLAVIIAMGYVLYRRYREIEKEDLDDLSKY